MSLPFSFQIVLDVYKVIQEEYRRIFNDVTEYGLDIAKLIRMHMDYEDHMWSMGKEPNHMSGGNVKFTNIYISWLSKLFNWPQEMLTTEKPAGSIRTGASITMHATSVGLNMWLFNKTFHGYLRAKFKWFVTSLARLYNAVTQVGGLEIGWPDLDYIISMHGSERIFCDGPPKDPQEFQGRYLLSICISARVHAKDYRHIGTYYPSISSESKSKGGLMAHSSIEEAINKLYGPDPEYKR